MATAVQSDNDDLSGSSDSDVSDDSDSDGDSDAAADCQITPKVKEPCKYYNNGRCKDGESCLYLHVCKYALKGECRYASKCKLNHPRVGRDSSRASSRASARSTSREPNVSGGRYYQWQLNDGTGWKDVDNDHIIEAQYCLPHTKSIKIYNTPYGAVSIDFNRMRVYGKSLRVRRLEDGNTVWIWYCTLRRKWIKYGDKNSKGKHTPVKSSDIEQEFRDDPSSSFTFKIGADTLEIRFREMRQVSKKRKRKVTRRPLYRQRQRAGVSQAASAIKNMSVGARPKWQFEGSSGAWHDYKRRSGTPTECSVTSEDIEKTYQRNPQDSMIFKLKGDSYKLDFRAMNQTNLKTKHTRKIRRLLV
ncbi:protein mono-ADP-ribosyltransferase PARP12 [Xiphias gladius]|uniref:protein mono-ADP-ribosyltransferase PARP12 n=1 Tax=Xiphias gladius TaxID=8245 RepID=UPI001A98BF0A|nr:protein mono-ADP-ribosyltransferase PARP12 [Xiphias gladius]